MPAPANRSPRYPAIDPIEAIADAKSLYSEFQRGVVAPEEIAKALGYKGLSGASRPRLAALKKYGIVEKRGKGLALTSRAINLAVRAEDSAQYQEAARNAVMDVELFENLLREHQDSSEQIIKEHLQADLAFTPDGASRACGAFLAAKDLLDSLDKSGDSSENSGASEEQIPDSEVAVGSWIQWTSRGQMQFPQPRKVVRIADHDGEQFAFVIGDDGKEGAVPMSQATLEQPPQATEGGSPPPPPMTLGDKPDVSQETSKIGGGSALIQWPKEIDEDGFEDLQYWLEGVLRKVARDAGVQYPKS